MASKDFPFDGLGVMVVEDEPFMRNLLSRLLHELGFTTVVTAEDGADALQRLEGSNLHVDAIVCDLDMPLIDGFDFIRMLRRSDKVSDKNVPIVVVTGHSEGRNLRKAVEAGIHGFVVKPVSKSSLMKRLLHALKREKIAFKTP